MIANNSGRSPSIPRAWKNMEVTSKPASSISVQCVGRRPSQECEDKAESLCAQPTSILSSEDLSCAHLVAMALSSQSVAQVGFQSSEMWIYLSLLTCPALPPMVGGIPTALATLATTVFASYVGHREGHGSNSNFGRLVHVREPPWQQP